MPAQVSATPAASASSALRRFYGQKVVWGPCAGFPNVNCTYVWVPLDYSKPRGTSIRLRVAVHPANVQAGKLGALFTNNGGPGGWGTSDAFHASEFYSAALVDHYDIVGFDPRGIGASSRLLCMTTPQLNTALGFGPTGVNQIPTTSDEATAYNNAVAALGADCAAKNPACIRHVGTREGARDLDIMRAVLRQSKLNYMAISYGTYLGAWYAQLFPKNVGRMVLDGAMDPARNFQQLAVDGIRAQETALHRFLADCPKHADCPAQLRGSASANYATFALLAKSLAATPLAVSGLEPLTYARFMTAVQARLYRDQDGWPLLRQELGLLINSNNGKALDEVAYGWLGKSTSTGEFDAGVAAGNAIWCYDWRAGNDLTASGNHTLETLAVSAPDFGTVDMWQQQVCVKWPVHTGHAAVPLHAVGAAPILVVGNRYDPATPYAWSVALAKQLKRGRLLTWNGDGHTSYRRGSACIDTNVDHYLLTGGLPKAGRVGAPIPRP
jgi:pimeloyl-ACP methyl ester carboxylesterase